jgi:hypothetical protein
VIWLAYAAVIVAIGLLLGDRLREVRQARERLAAFKKRSLGL